MGASPPAAATASDRRESILAAALALFAERGFYGTAVPEVAERARVGAGTIYRYFPSKEALVNAVYQQHKGELADALLRGFDGGAPSRASFGVVWRNACAFARARPLALQFLEMHHHAPYLDKRSRELETELLGTAHALIGVAIERQILKPLAPPVLLAMVWGAFRGLVQGGCDGRLALDDEVVAQTEECVWEAIRR